jgi:hypothetical protein
MQNTLLHLCSGKNREPQAPYRTIIMKALGGGIKVMPQKS